MWQQTLFSKTNGLPSNDGMQDGFHILTTHVEQPPGETQRLAKLMKQHGNGLKYIISKSGDCIYVGISGVLGDILGDNHLFAREANLNPSSSLSKEPGRRIGFTHSYHSKVTSVTIPDLCALRAQQSSDLLRILQEAHDSRNGRTLVSMPEVQFPSIRNIGTDWNRIASDVEAGKCEGGIFASDGKLLERFEAEVKKASSLAQKKTIPIMAEAASGVTTKPGCIVIGAMVVGAVLLGWAALTMMKRSQDKPTTERLTVAMK